ncbi:hypothetical protein [Roseovarius pacificus]|uniref:hypothetical protein n=1 Tax=Roseovarius pacificus TaxID=337701 RepID=UPI002599BA74|nr:hypothetical protein [Roseovarius pacificus]MDW3117263.1 hypothetical protein [Roseovarius pacificus]
MKHLAFTAILALIAAPAVASQCPMDMSKIDAALETAQLSDEQMAEVKALRAEGEELHAAGDHAASVETLGQAKDILGIE